MAYSSTVKVPAGQVLSVTADANSVGTVRRIPAQGDTTSYAATAVAASTTVTVGPFLADRFYEVLSDPGQLTYSLAPATELGGEVATLASPTITTPTITGGTSTAKMVVTNIAADGAIAIAQGIVAITKSSALAALTLAAPTADQEGTVLIVTSRTAKAHTITATGLIQDGVTGGAKNTATFAAFAGASIGLAAINLTWHVLYLDAVTVA